ncbi:MAG: choice-of-anchor J domain-containing protein [Bacteroidales bacterium]|nr:choice-of-anchor J domain-containing protein [Bacteroidales bacterium]
MKKIVLVMLAVLACSASFAQFQRAPQCREANPAKGAATLPAWGQIAAPFTATDINGNPVSLQSYLDAGISVVVDYSCCWCGPCWSLHTTGILEALDAEDSIQVIWVEIEDGNTTAQIYGTNGSGSSATTQGNWTLDSHGNPVTYPIIDDASCLSTCASLYEGYVPSVYLITPSGYFCSLYGEDWGFGTSTAPAQAVSIVNGLIGQAPRAGQAPIVSINGLTTAVVGNPVNFTADIISVDPIVSYSWTFADGTPATANTAAATTTWATTGNHQVTLEVTNTTGTTTATLNVNVIDWTWGDEMSYTQGGSYVSSVGTGGEITWGAKYPASFMSGRNYLENVKVYANEAAHYTLDVYQTNPGATPGNSDMLYEYTYAVAAGDNTLSIYDQVQLNGAKDLWIVFTCADASYPAAGTDFTGDPNGSLVCFNGEWSPVYELNPSLMYTWMIAATTSVTAPAMAVELNGPANASTNTPVTFTAVGPAAASYSWTFANGNPATATGATATTTWTAGGTYAVTLTATLNGETATRTMNVNVVSCDPRNLPFTCGFEANEDFGCWNFVDADGDGFNWDLEMWAGSQYVHGGSGAIGTASYINGIGILTPDQWMITPELIIPANGANLTYYVGGVSEMYGDKYSIYVSTTGAEPSNFTANAPIHTETPTSANFTVKHIDLSQFAGQTIRLGFRHYESVDGYWLIFDDLTVAAGQNAINNANVSNVAIYPNPVVSVLNIEAEGLQEVNVLDLNGRVVMTSTTNTVDMSNLSNGCYFVRVITNAGVTTQKIVK